MKFLTRTKPVILLIVLLAALLRLPLLGDLPAGVTIDEAGQGISAYSILKTGKDEWGDFLPLNPRGFGDYKPPVYMYLLVPSIAVFGLNEFAVRLPSALAGILTVAVMYYLVSALFKDRNLALLAAFLLAVSPWHVYYSRLGWESNVGLLFFVTGLWLFLKGLKNSVWLTFSVLALGLSAMSYHSFKLLSPLIALSLVFIYRKEIFSYKKALVLPVIFTCLFALILGYGFLFSGAGRRAADQSVLKEENLSLLREEQFNDGFPQPLPRVLNNKYEFFLSKATDNYIGYFSFPFLFGPHRSDGSILNFPQSGLLYIWQLPPILLGIWFLLKRKDKTSALIFAWLFLSPLPATFTQDYMHAGRAQALFPVLMLISAVGFKEAWSLIKPRYKGFALVSAFFIVLLSLSLRIDSYLFHTFNKPLGGLKQGYREAAEYIKRNGDRYDKIIFTKAHSEPHAFLAFYLKTDPGFLQKESAGWRKFEMEGKRYLDMTDYRLGNIEFKNADLSRDRHEKNTLLVGSAKEIPPGYENRQVIKDASGEEMFILLETNEIKD